MKEAPIPVIDLFAGPGGLGEGFTCAGLSGGKSHFRICLSIEQDPHAHQTLELRSFFHQFKNKDIPEEYYQFLRDEITRRELFGRYPAAAERAQQQSWRAVLGINSPEEVDARIEKSLAGRKTWILVGGPPCQAYSIVGRSRRGKAIQKDPRLFLYREFLRIIARYTPPVFVMENVKGLLSSKSGGNSIIKQIIQDLQEPAAAVRNINHVITAN